MVGPGDMEKQMNEDDSLEFLGFTGHTSVPDGQRCQMRKKQPNRCSAKATKQYGKASLCVKHFLRIVDLIGEPVASEPEMSAELND